VVWLDLQKGNKNLPLFDNIIFIKATRISWGKIQETKDNQPSTDLFEIGNSTQNSSDFDLIGGGGHTSGSNDNGNNSKFEQMDELL